MSERALEKSSNDTEPDSVEDGLQHETEKQSKLSDVSEVSVPSTLSGVRPTTPIERLFEENYKSTVLQSPSKSRKSSARPSMPKTHLQTHSERSFICNICNKSFTQAAVLTAHVRTHSGEKPFGCPVCDRRFSQSSSVTTHMRTHSGEKPYRCRLCKKAFSDSSTFTKHMRIHSGAKPYECKLCFVRFSQSGNLNRHMRLHDTTSELHL